MQRYENSSSAYILYKLKYIMKFFENIVDISVENIDISITDYFEVWYFYMYIYI